MKIGCWLLLGVVAVAALIAWRWWPAKTPGDLKLQQALHEASEFEKEQQTLQIKQATAKRKEEAKKKVQKKTVADVISALEKIEDDLKKPVVAILPSPPKKVPVVATVTADDLKKFEVSLLQKVRDEVQVRVAEAAKELGKIPLSLPKSPEVLPPPVTMVGGMCFPYAGQKPPRVVLDRLPKYTASFVWRWQYVWGGVRYHIWYEDQYGITRHITFYQ